MFQRMVITHSDYYGMCIGWPSLQEIGHMNVLTQYKTISVNEDM